MPYERPWYRVRFTLLGTHAKDVVRFALCNYGLDW